MGQPSACKVSYGNRLKLLTVVVQEVQHHLKLAEPRQDDTLVAVLLGYFA